jgi:predicted nuclease of predicted toxin-antitoxin system
MTIEGEPGLDAAAAGRPPEHTFFFDRNLGHRVPRALSAAGWNVEVHDDHFEPSATDTEIFDLVRERDWVYVTQDRKIRSRVSERQALIGNRLRTFSIASTANLSAQVTTDVLIRAHAEMLKALANETSPFVIAIHKDGSLHALSI